MPQQKTDWTQVWAKGSIGFHKDHTNPLLEKYLPLLNECPHILVPLCGKTLDLHFLHQKGHSCSGIEAVSQAIQEFFSDWNVQPTVSYKPLLNFQHEGITLYKQDIFQLRTADLSPIDAIYDRAALVAFHPDLQKKYVEHILPFLPKGGKILLITFEMPRSIYKGPPYSLSPATVREMYDTHTQKITLLEESIQHENDSPWLKERGLAWCKTHAWLMEI